MDYFLRPKLAWYAISRELRPVTIGISRNTKGEKRSFEFWGVNSLLTPVDIEVNTEYYSISSGALLTKLPMSYTLPPNQASEIWVQEVNSSADISDIVVSVSYKIASGKELRSSANWPQPLKYIDFSHSSEVTIEVTGEEITLETAKPLKGIILDVEEDDDSDLEWSDNGFDLMPGESVVVMARGLKERSVVVSWYGKDSEQSISEAN